MLLHIAVAVAAMALLVGLALYLLLKYRDRAAAAAAFVAAAAVGMFWYWGSIRTGGLEDELATTRERLAALEHDPSVRGFTPEGRELMVRRLSDYVGPTAFVVANDSDPETVEYARQIVSVLKDAGWKIPPSFGMTYQPIVLPGHEGAEPGVILGVSGDVPREFAASVLRVLRDGGIDAVEGPHWPGTEHPISILVGRRRDP